jgi:hypothetical protein
MLCLPTIEDVCVSRQICRCEKVGCLTLFVLYEWLAGRYYANNFATFARNNTRRFAKV